MEEPTFRCAACGRERPITECTGSDTWGFMYCVLCDDEALAEAEAYEAGEYYEW